MKQCPTCNQTYYDDTQSFCLMDGTRLINESEEKTVVMQSPLTTDSEVKTVVRQSPQPKKSKIPLMLGLLCLLVLAGAGLMAWLFISFYPQTENIRDNRKPSMNVKSSSALPSPPRPASTANSLVKESSPRQDDVKKTSDNEDSDEVTPIDWDTTIGGFKGEVGQTYSFRCPEGGTKGSVYGSDIYAGVSSICTAAVHAGLITLEQGGVVTIEFRPGRPIYGSTTRNGIKSNTVGEWKQSFVFR